MASMCVFVFGVSVGVLGSACASSGVLMAVLAYYHYSEA